ncbi:MAG: type III pantothenate kinase [Ignavibacteria bacterium]
MLLALDIGNSTIAAALFEGEHLRGTYTAPSTVQRTAEERWHMIETLLLNSGCSHEDVTHAGISSVVPFLTQRFSELIAHNLGCHPLIINGTLDLGFRIHYRDASTLGADRLCSAAAAFEKFGGPIIVVDFGTATTYGVVDAHGDFLGGAIALGVRTTAETLQRRTAQLPSFELQPPTTPIANDTVSAMQAGTIFGTIDAVEGMLARIRKALGIHARAVATGGLSPVIAPLIPSIEHHEPSLVLEGVRLLTSRLFRRR